MQKFNHHSETVTHCINHLMQQLPYPCKITETKDLSDYGNEYQFNLNFQISETETVPATLAKIQTEFNALPIHQESDYLITLHADYTNNHIFLYLTFAK